MQIRSFLELVGYYRRFIPNFTKIAKSMTKLLEKGAKFKWSQQCERDVSYFEEASHHRTRIGST
jgi:hypothetical protein